MFDPKKFTTPTARPLPVVLLLDVSGSMSGEKIDNLNKAVRDM
ncbi:TPA: VWA domain-containing protein, partial [Klebsiella quasipneumoniae subsp. quasipneumoniae]|nr:tellurite resistance protein TerY [Klebsiella quasipneumoniae subsp. quasipneumoniae]HCM7667836.1 VWA domain-containing protein [Klebsiella quasipneumoniae subsp. quasipneumoniae]